MTNSLPRGLSAATSPDAREAHIRSLRDGTLTTIFSRDVFNEGIDIPEVNTILLLRPTESVTVYLQQIGRGLRRHASKEVCTILDFIAQYRREYRFDLRLRALTGLSRRELVDAVERGFPFLPSGCHIQMERQAQEWVLEHVKQAVQTGSKALRAELVQQAIRLPSSTSPTLWQFLAESGVELQDVAGAGGWTHLKRAAGLEARPESSQEPRLQRGIARLLHIDDDVRISTWLRWLESDSVPELVTEREKRLASMLLVSLWSLRATPDTFASAWTGLWEPTPRASRRGSRTGTRAPMRARDPHTASPYAGSRATIPPMTWEVRTTTAPVQAVDEPS